MIPIRWNEAFGPLVYLATFALIVGILSYGQAVLVPLALAGFLAFILTPPVGLLERWKVHRALAVVLVLTVTLARPERRNAIDGELASRLREAFEAAADDGEVRALILTGEGKAFSAGGDLSRFERDWDPREFRHDSHRLTSLITLLERLEKPTVAAINGAVTGAGTQLALVCDVRLAAASARFIYREGRLGIIPSHGGVTRLVKLIGQARARDVLLGGEELSATEAHHVGLVTAVVDDDQLQGAARERVELMLKRSPQAYAAAKRLLWLAGNVDLESGMVAEGLAQSLLIGTDEHKQAVREARQR